jgi:hypothetical protein
VRWVSLGTAARVEYATQALLHLGNAGYRFLGRKCCRRCFSTVHDVTNHCLDAAHKRLGDVLKGECDGVDDDNKKKASIGRPRTAGRVAQELVEGWVRAQCMVNACKGNLHLPFIPVVRLVYDEFQLVHGEEVCSETTFGAAWSEAMVANRVSMPRIKSDLKTCSLCWSLAQERRAALRVADSDACVERVKALEDMHSSVITWR